ncbi:MAG: hypothetical protein R3A52_31570 [Polyangiales bacterium]
MRSVPFDALTVEDQRVLLASARQLGVDLTRTARGMGWPRLRRETVTDNDERALDGLCHGFCVVPPRVGSAARESLWAAFFVGVDSVTAQEAAATEAEVASGVRQRRPRE